MPRQKTSDEDEKPKGAEPPEGETSKGEADKPAEPVLVEKKGKFSIFQVGKKYVIRDNMERLIGTYDALDNVTLENGDTVPGARNVLFGMNR